MIELHKLCLISIIAFTLHNNIEAICIKAKNVPTREERYQECNRGYSYNCQWETRLIEIGPIEYTCLYTSMAEINTYSQSDTNIKNKVFINNSDIPSLTPNMYYWTNLIEMRLHNTNTSQIIPGFFNKFDTLSILEITNNRVETLVDGVFSALTLLTTLNLSCNSITDLTRHSFSGLLHLKILDLSKNKIASISSKVFDNENLLQYVDISQNLVTDVANIFNKTSLRSIKLSKNRLSEFDFGQLQYNSELLNVDLSENQIKNIGNISNTIRLNLSYNCLESIDNSMLNPNTEILDLSNNNVSVISEKSFNNMTSLQYLYLDHNNIKSIPRESLNELTGLKHLDLSFNHISQIQFGLFNNLNLLVYLDLSNNDMLLDFHTLTTLKSLEICKLQNNKVKNFDANLLVTRFKNLNFVSLGDNWWKCSELAHTIHLLHVNHINISPGNNTKTNNILGIACKDTADFKEESIVFNGSSKATNQENHENPELFINRAYYEDNIQNTTFYKLLENISQQLLKQNASISPNNTENSFIEYLNQNFNGTNFYKYMEDLKKFENTNTSTFSQMKNFFGDGFNQTNFYKYLNSLKASKINNVTNTILAPVQTPALNETIHLLSSINNKLFNMSDNFKKVLVFLREHSTSSALQSNNPLESVHTDSKMESQALVDGHFQDYGQNFRDNLIVTNILLAFILCSIVAQVSLLYYIFWKPKKSVSSIQEQVQLM